MPPDKEEEVSVCVGGGGGQERRSNEAERLKPIHTRHKGQQEDD